MMSEMWVKVTLMEGSQEVEWFESHVSPHAISLFHWFKNHTKDLGWLVGGRPDGVRYSTTGGAPRPIVTHSGRWVTRTGGAPIAWETWV